MNLLTLLEMAAEGAGDRIAVGDPADGLSYSRLLECVGAAAERFAASAAERVVLCDESSPAVPIALFAAAAAGMPYVPLNYRLPDDELRHLGARVQPALAVADEASAARLGALDGVEVIERSRLLGWPGHNDAERRHDEAADVDATSGDTAGDSGTRPHSTAAAAPAASGGDDIAVLLFTSGTTGDPKSAVLRHRHLTSYVLGSVEFMGAGPDEAVIVSVPPYHIAGVASVLSSVYAGRRIVMLPRFDADAWIDTVASQGVTHAMVVPTMLARIVEALERRGGEPMLAPQTLSYGGGRMPLPVISRALELFPITGFVNAYGLTETSSTIALLGPDEHRIAQYSDDPAARQRLVSVGRVLPGVEVAIRDDRGRDLPAGTPGEVFVRGEQVSGEYLDEGSLLIDGWFPTHDGGYIDDDGYLVVTGRNDDVIIRGGENMSPGEIENVVLSHPGVKDAAAIGVPSTHWGEKVVLVVVPADSGEPEPADGAEPADDTAADDTAAAELAEALRDLVRERLRSSRVPEHVIVRAELPYNDTGKLLRRLLREEYAALGDVG